MGKLSVLTGKINDIETDLYPVTIPQGIIDPKDKLPLSNDLHKIKDKEYIESDYSGLGRCFLKRSADSDNNILTQDMLLSENTVYILEYDFDLNGQTITIPQNSVLKFEGGSLYNGTINGQNTVIASTLNKIFDTDLKLSGRFNIEAWYPEWFGAVSGTRDIMSTKAIQAALNAASTNIRVVMLTGAFYTIDDTLLVYSNRTLTGNTSAPRHYRENAIYQTVNKDAIRLTSDEVNIQRICIKDIQIENLYKGDDMSNNGIVVYNGDVQTYFYHNEIRNVGVVYFDAGFKYEGYGDGAFAYNYFHCLNCHYNKIGLYIFGNVSSDTSVTKRPWANLNKWEFCKFMSNSIGGIYFRGTRSQQENVFYSCAIEGNGKNYSLADYETYTCGGWAFRGSNSSCYGFTRFYNCYIENNMPKRDVSLGYDSSKEYVYGNYVYPIDIETNEANAAFVCYKQSIEVKNCLLSKYVRLFRGQTEFQIRFEGNDYDWGRPGYKAKEDMTIDHFFFIDWTDGMANYNSIYINEDYPKHDRDTENGTYLSLIKSLFRFSDRANTTTMRGFKIYAKHPLLEEIIDYRGRDANNNPLIYSAPVYIDTSASNDNTGISKCQPVPSFAQAERISNWYNSSKEVLWVLTANYNITYTDNWANGTNNRNVRLIGEQGVEYNAKAIKTIYTPWIVENIIFNVNVNDWKHIFESYANRIEFRNCTFNLQTVDKYIARLMRGGEIVFINCEFNVLDNSKGTEICIQHPQYYNSKIVLSNCTIQEGFTIARTTDYWIVGNTVTKNAGEVVRPNGKGLCFYNGKEVINPDGTLYSRVRVIDEDISQIKNMSTLTYNKIVKDIDLKGETLTLPHNCRFDFQGGKFKNGTIVLNGARCMPMGMSPSYYFDTDTLTIQGDYAEGQILYDYSLKRQKLWNGTAWVNLDGSDIE